MSITMCKTSRICANNS